MDVFIQAPVEWAPPRSDRIWKLRAPAYVLSDAPAAFHRSPRQRILNSEASMRRVGSRCQASTFNPCLFYIFREIGSAAGSLTTHIDDIPRCGEPDVLPKIRDYLDQRFGEIKLRDFSCAHVGMGAE